MSKWADWCITAVSYNPKQSHIDHVVARPDEGTSLGAPKLYSREEVVSAIENGAHIVTAPPSETKPGTFDKGAKVEVVRVGREKYLTTDPNNTKRDNLGNLPTF